MMKAQPDKLRIDCVKLKLQIQAEIASETEGMSPKERLAYVRKLARDSALYPLVLEARAAPQVE